MATPDLGVSNARRTVSAAGTAATFRIPARAATSQVLASLLVGSGATASQLIAIRRITVEVDTTVAKTAASPFLRTRRITAHTGGATLTPGVQDTTNTLATTLGMLQDASADGTVASTALTSTQLSGAPDLWQQVVPRLTTLVGEWNPNALSLLPDDGGWTDDNPLILRAGQGLQIRVDTPAAPTAGDFVYGVKVAFEQFAFG